MTNPYIYKIIKNYNRKSQEKSYTLYDWVLKNFIYLIILAGCISFFAYQILPNFGIDPFGVNRVECAVIETDAQNILAALASYFSEPDKNEVPTLEALLAREALTLNPKSTVIIDGPEDRVKVTVINNKLKCPRGNKYEIYYGGTAGEWYDE